jgi:hypothetical protein
MASLSEHLLFSYVPIHCPRCQFPFEVQLVDVTSQVYRRCPGCRVRIKLQDSGGSGAAALADLDTRVKQLQDVFRRLQ